MREVSRATLIVFRVDWPMSVVQFGLANCAFWLGMVCFASPAAAQQGYEFGIRFIPVNFRPVNFNGFSFRQTSFRAQTTQPIQFERITFPAFNSRAVRRDAVASRNRPLRVAPVSQAGSRLQQRRLQLATRGGNRPIFPTVAADSPGGRRRLVLNSPGLPTVQGRRRFTSGGPQPTRFARSADPLRVARSVLRTANRGGRDSIRDGGAVELSRVRRVALARRIGDDRLGRVEVRESRVR